MVDNKCLLQLLNNYGLTAMDIGAILNCSYAKARFRIETLDFRILEVYALSEYLKIPLDDFVQILNANKDILNRHLLINKK